MMMPVTLAHATLIVVIVAALTCVRRFHPRVRKKDLEEKKGLKERAKKDLKERAKKVLKVMSKKGLKEMNQKDHLEKKRNHR